MGGGGGGGVWATPEGVQTDLGIGEHVGTLCSQPKTDGYTLVETFYTFGPTYDRMMEMKNIKSNQVSRHRRPRPVQNGGVTINGPGRMTQQIMSQMLGQIKRGIGRHPTWVKR